MPIATCPPPADLECLFLGGLSADAVDRVEQHLLDCDPCLRELKSLLGAKETLAGMLRDETGGDLFGADTVVDGLIGQLAALRPTAPTPPNQAKPMIAFSCSGCPKKLSVKEDLAGKKVKCPGCGQVMLVPTAVAAIGELRTLAPDAPSGSSAPGAPRNVTVDADHPTIPPPSKPDATRDNEAPDAGHDSSLTDFLAPPQADDELGRLGKYRILKVLGHGGMGVVFKAEDPKLKRSVALKAMLPALAASASSAKRFLREAEAMAAVEHDHIVRIYQIDEERGVPFLAMEFLKGEPLDDRLKRDDKVLIADVLRIGREIGEALEAAHATGLIHRDIKPANVWLEAPRGRVKILDFGLARAATQESGLTQQGAIIGTPAYMAPEQARGETVDHRCDLFSLGVVLYRLCTGQLPFRGRDTVSTLMEVALHAPPPPVLTNLELPQELSDLVMKLLEKDPSKRFATAGAVVEALRAIEADLPLRKATPEKTEAAAWQSKVTGKPVAKETKKASPPINQRRPVALIAVALAAAFGALACVAGAVVFFWPAANGTVRIEVNDPDIQVAFDKKALVFKGAEKQELRVSPGAHGLHVQRGDLEFNTDKLVLKKGETITLKVEWLKNGKLQLVQDGKVIGGTTLPPVVVGPKEVIAPVASPPATDDGALAYELRFDGGQSVTLPSMPLIPAGPFTLETYVNVARIFMPNGHALVETHSARIGVGGGWGPLWLHARDDILKAGPLPPGMNHVAGVWADDELRLFVNGKRVGAQKMAPRLETKSGGELGRDFFGTMRGVRLSKSARYDKDFTPPVRFAPDKDTIAVYRFEEGAGDVLKDSSGNGYDAKINGAKWVKAGLLKAIDLLKLIDLKKHVVKGDWRFDGPTLVTPSTNDNSRPDRVAIPVTPPDTYELEIVANRLPGNASQGLVIGLVVGDSRCTAAIDVVSPGVSSRLLMVDGGERRGHNGWILDADKPVRLICKVRKDALTIFRDETEILAWKGDAKKSLACDGRWDMPNPRQLFLGSIGTGNGFRITKLELRPSFAPPIPSKAADNVQTPAYALRFDGKEIVELPPMPKLPDEPRTLELYAEVTQTFEGKGSGEGHRLMEVRPIQIGVGGAFWGPLWFEAGGAVSIRPNPLNSGINHVAVVWAADEVRAFVNGKRVAAQKRLAMPFVNGPGYLGRDFIGTIHGARVSKSARYDKNFTPPERFEADKDTIAVYRFEEGAGHMLKDSSGNGHDGKIVGAKWVKVTPTDGINLLKLVDLKKNVVGRNKWRFDGPTLVTPGREFDSDTFPQLAIPFTPPETYELEIAACGLPGLDLQGLVLGIVVGDSRCAMVCDHHSAVGVHSGLRLVDGARYLLPNPERLFVPGTPARLICKVSKDTVTVFRDDKQILAWKGDAKKSLSCDSWWDTANPRQLFLGSIGLGSGFRITKLEIRPAAAPAGTQLDPAWLKAVAALPAEKQLEAVKAEMMKRNPGFDGAMKHRLGKDGAVRELEFMTDRVTDIAPVSALAGLAKLGFHGTEPGKGRLADLSPLKGMKLGILYCPCNKVFDLAPLAGMPLTWLDCRHSAIADLAPLKGMPLQTLICMHTPVADLSPLKGMKTLEYVICANTRVKDLSPVGDMQLRVLSCDSTEVADLAPLKDMKLAILSCQATQVPDLAPLNGMTTLTELRCANTPVTDLAPVKDAKLTILKCDNTKVTNLLPLQGMPLKELKCDFNAERDTKILRAIKTLEKINDKPAAQFWKEVSAVAPFEDWLKAVGAMQANEQEKAVTAKLLERNPGFDGQVTYKRDPRGYVTELTLPADNVTDLSPVRALTALQRLQCAGSARRKSRLTDLAPLAGMKLTALDCRKTKVSDLAPLKAMPRLRTLVCSDTAVADLSPLRGMPLTSLTCGSTRVNDLTPLQGMPLTSLSCDTTRVGNLAPLKGMQLTLLNCARTPVDDLSVLRDMPLVELCCDDTPVADLTPLKDMKLAILSCRATQVSDLAPLRGVKLTWLDCRSAKVTDLAPLRGMPLRRLRCDFDPKRDAAILRSIKTLETINGKPAAEFWKDAPAAPAASAARWFEEPAVLPAAKQVEQFTQTFPYDLKIAQGRGGRCANGASASGSRQWRREVANATWRSQQSLVINSVEL